MASSTVAALKASMADDVVRTIAQLCLHRAGVRQMMKLRGVSQEFRRSVDQHVLRMQDDLYTVDADVLQLQGCARVQCAKNRAVHWIALACVSFARSEECMNKRNMRLFMYTVAYNCRFSGIYARALSAKSKAEEHEFEEHRLQLVEMATSRLATVMPGFLEEEIRNTLALAFKLKDTTSLTQYHNQRLCLDHLDSVGAAALARDCSDQRFREAGEAMEVWTSSALS